MNETILKVGPLYVVDGPIIFGCPSLSKNFRDAKLFNNFDDAISYTTLLSIECEVVNI